MGVPVGRCTPAFYGKTISDETIPRYPQTSNASGCNIISAIFNIGKNKFFSILEKNPRLNNTVQIYKQNDIELIAIAKERFLIALYGDKGIETSGSLCHQRFAKSNIIESRLGMAPHKIHRSGAGKGAKLNLFQLEIKDPAPQVLLQFISCKCKTKCSATYGCRKAGPKCSIICDYCNGQICENVLQILYDFEDEDEKRIQA
ncbi:uncharacterized protein [Polyergus mexicanus]|uniref:uncharacterized protein n=1 Tax=Polyergus mexicanus TaxID=615972 RepID=UPI0038B553E8